MAIFPTGYDHNASPTGSEKIMVSKSGTNKTEYSELSELPISTATQTALNAKQDTLTGLTASVTELNYTDGVTSAIQTQINSKQDTLVSATNIKTINGSSVLGSGDLTITASANIPVKDEGTTITSAVSSFNFVGSGVTATNVGNDVTVTIPGGSGADTSLSNLSSVAINTSLVSDTDNTDDLGTTLKKWANIFVTTIGATATRVTKGWFTDLEVTNAITGSITGNAATVTVANEASDTTCYPLFATATSGSLPAKSNTNLSFNSSTGNLSAAYVTTNEVIKTGGTGNLLINSTPIQVDTIEVGHASDTTLSRSAAGQLAMEGVDILSTSNTKTVTNKDLTSSTNKIPVRYVACSLNGTTALTTSDKAYFRIPSALNGMNLVSVSATVGTGASGSSSSGVPTFTVKNVTDGNQMLSTSLTVDAGEYTSATAATAAVINTSFDDVVTDDLIEVAVTTSGTGVTYTVVTLGFQTP